MSSRATLESTELPASGRYEPLEPLGKGGMASVWKVRDRVTGDVVALKRLLPRADEVRRSRAQALFEREYHTLSQLAHPRVVEVYDYDVDGQGPYFTMELLDGGDLHARAPVPWRQACAFMRDVCSVLSLLHSRRMVHRDVSPRNIRCTERGLAKLIDFGAMAPMGRCKDVVGTPAICPPEVVNREQLDARADLFSLGCTIYYALVGKHAYPAPDFGQLPLLWGSRPMRPSQWASDLPPELDALIMSMISVNPEARPATAAEVMGRLSAIADLPVNEQLPVSHAYLSSPRLVGRDGVLSRVRKKLAYIENGGGGALLIAGPPGVGRSRVLHASLLEAKLRGASVVVGDASDAAHSPFGVVSALAQQLIAVRPQAARQAAEPFANMLSAVVPELAEAHREGFRAFEEIEDPIQRRSHLQQALLQWFSASSQGRALVVAVDDIDLADEFSQAFVSLLAHHASESKLLVIATVVESGQDDVSSARKLLIEVSNRLTLDCLRQRETETLLRSVFGDLRSMWPLAQRLHRLTGGNPRDIMALAQHLVDRGVVHYEEGAWSMSADVHDAELPASMAEALRQKVARLNPDGIQLARALALAPELSLRSRELALLLGHDDQARLLRVLDELLTSGVLCGSGGRYQLSQRGWAAPLLAGVDRAQKRALYLHLVGVYRALGDDFRVAQNLLKAGDRHGAVDALLRHAEETNALTENNPAGYVELLHSLPEDWLEVYEAALRHCEDQGRDASQRFVLLRRACSLVTSGLGETDVLQAQVKSLTEAVGLDLYAGLGPELAPEERLKEMFARARERYERAPEQARVMAPQQALLPLASSVMEAVGSVASRLDLALWDSLPSLRPLSPLSPLFDVVDQLVQGVRCRLTARTREAIEIYDQVLARAVASDRAGLDEGYQHYLLAGVKSGLGTIEACRGSARALTLAEQIEAEPLYQDQAALVRMLFHLWQGDARSAETCRQQFEIVRIQNGGRQYREGGHMMGELSAYSVSDDLVQLKQALPAVFRLAERLASWLPVQNFARGEYHRIRGAHAAALKELEMASAMIRLGRHQMSCEIAGAHIRAMAAMGQLREARDRGGRQLRAVESEGLGYTTHFLRMPLAVIHARLGELPAAHALAEEALEQLDSDDFGLLLRGLAHETRARVALEARDQKAFGRHVEACAEAYLRHGNRSLAAKYDRLLVDGRRVGFRMTARPGAFSLVPDPSRVLDLSSVLSECRVAERRARRALELMVEQCGALGGALYAVERHGPVLASEVGLSPHSSAVEPLVRVTLLSLVSDGEDMTKTNMTEADNTSSNESHGVNIPGDDEHVMHTLVVAHGEEGDFHVTGLAVFVSSRGAPFEPPTALAAQLSRYWFDIGDATDLAAQTCGSCTLV